MLSHPISPFFDSESRILILGSFPSVKSRETGFYYGHPQNRFWKVLSEVFSDFLPVSVEEKKDFLKRNHIALFDVIQSCEIEGSSDSSIQNVTPNDIRKILDACPVRCIYCNGTTAYRLYQTYIRSTLQDYPVLKNAVPLPSTSPANAAYSLSALICAWSRVRIPLQRTGDPEKCYRLNDYSRDFYGKKLYKLSLNGGFTCPNRDGSKGTGGCTFCREGSGSFSGNGSTKTIDIEEQLRFQKALVSAKLPRTTPVSYIAYFQSYTGTYADVSYLEQLYMEAIRDPQVDILSVATRPDCLGENILALLENINRIKPVWIELGLQTSNEKTAVSINRCFKNKEYRNAVRKLHRCGITMIITHVILGLPGESTDDMLSTVRYAAECGTTGIKFQLLHVLEDTELANQYLLGKIRVLSLDEYCRVLKKCVSCLPPDIVVHRLTGDGDKKHLLAPIWSGNKKAVINTIDRLDL